MAKTIEEKIKDVFNELIETKPNASFVYSFIYATDRDPKKAEANGFMNLCGSKEEVETHLEELHKEVARAEKQNNKNKKKIYGTKEN